MTLLFLAQNLNQGRLPVLFGYTKTLQRPLRGYGLKKMRLSSFQSDLNLPSAFLQDLAKRARGPLEGSGV